MTANWKIDSSYTPLIICLFIIRLLYDVTTLLLFSCGATLIFTRLISICSLLREQCRITLEQIHAQRINCEVIDWDFHKLTATLEIKWSRIENWNHQGKHTDTSQLIIKYKEGCESGWIGRSRKPLYASVYRGFESHPLRQVIVRHYLSEQGQTDGQRQLLCADKGYSRKARPSDYSLWTGYKKKPFIPGIFSRESCCCQVTRPAVTGWKTGYPW